MCDSSASGTALVEPSINFKDLFIQIKSGVFSKKLSLELSSLILKSVYKSCKSTSKQVKNDFCSKLLSFLLFVYMKQAILCLVLHVPFLNCV